MVIAMTNLGYIKRMSPDNFRSQNRGGRGIKGMQTIDEDFITDIFMTTNHHSVDFFTNFGRVYRLKAYQIPEAGRTSRGTAIINLLQLQPEEKITAMIPFSADGEAKYLFMATKKGTVKKTKLEEYANVRKNGLTAIVLREGDELIEVKPTNGEQDIILVSKKGMAIMFNEKDVRSMGRASTGVRGMSLAEDDEVVGMQITSQGEAMLTVTEYGMGKRTMLTEFRKQSRGGKGLICHRLTDKTGNIVGAKLVNDEREILLITNEGVMIRIAVSDISIIGRNTSGVKLMKIDRDSNVRVASIAKVRESSQQNEEDADADGMTEAPEDTDPAENDPDTEE